MQVDDHDRDSKWIRYQITKDEPAGQLEDWLANHKPSTISRTDVSGISIQYSTG